jgi:hypothetical protein
MLEALHGGLTVGRLYVCASLGKTNFDDDALRFSMVAFGRLTV